jgi:Spy/CpxP family protein refolding chaperone
MLTKSLKIITLGLMGTIALNVLIPTITPAKETPKPTVMKPAPSIWEQLDLSKDQKTKLQAIRTKRTKAISQVLRKDQKDTFDKLRGKKKLADILKELKLDDKQKKLVAAANQQAMKEIMSILKPEQQKKLKARQETAE